MTPLTGKMLLAMPGLEDPRFEHAVILICAHSDDGAMGLIVNKPAEGVAFTDILEQLNITADAGDTSITVYFGGPVEPGRGFVVHTNDYDNNDSTLPVTDDIGMTATFDILEDIANGHGPRDYLLALGYAGWGPGQLEDEMLQNGWMTCDLQSDIVFAMKDERKWTASMKSLGINPLMLSAQSGRA